MVDAHLSTGKIDVEHLRGDKISPAYLNKIFKEDGYRFSDHPIKTEITSDGLACAIPTQTTNVYQNLFYAVLIIAGFLFLNKTGFTSWLQVDGNSSLPVFLIFGLLAGFSSCAALVGGLILSISKQWIGQYGNSEDMGKKLEPHILFNAGRVLGYGFFGVLLGMAGNFFKLSPMFTAIMVLVISAVMVLLGLQMLGVKALQKFQIRLPKSVTGKVADESNFTGKWGPAMMGALTFFLPCGFTITAQALALASGHPIQGGLIMTMFALGTLPGLMAIGFSSVKMYSNPKMAGQFSIIAGALVLFFALFNANNQLNVLGLPNISDVFASNSTSVNRAVAGNTADLPPMVNGKQVVKITASSFSYTPQRIKMRANTPTVWEVTAQGISGCTNAIISRGLFEGQIDLVDGQVATKEFTSPKPGLYKYSCWMGMVSGTVEVVDGSGTVGAAANAQPVESGAKGCGCGSGGSGTCGGSR